jgi:sugar phosphate permease
VVGACLSTTATYLTLVPGLVMLGLGQGAGYTLMFGAATAGIDARDQGVASGLASTTQQIGGAVGLAVLVAVANSGGNSAGNGMTIDGLRTAVFLAAAGIVVATMAVLGFTPHNRKADPADLPIPDATPV